MRYLLIFCLIFSLSAQESPFDNLALGMPSQADYVINREGYAVGFSLKYKQPIWVIYRLTKDEVLTEKVTRNTTFTADPLIPITNMLINDYSKSGYDRGHLVPANDFRWGQNVMDECFYISIISPQLPSFNRGKWRQLETLISKWAITEEEIYIITGTIFSKNPPAIGINKIPIPSHFYKIIYDVTPPQKMIAFIIPHQNFLQPLTNYATTVDAVEHITQQNFFSKLPLEKQNHLESSIDIRVWNLPL